MILSIDEIGPKLRNTTIERGVASHLRTLAESDKLDFIEGLISSKHKGAFSAGLELARTCLTKPQSFERLLAMGLATADCSTAKYWLDATLHGLGYLRLLRILQSKVPAQAEQVKHMRYWLNKYLPSDDENIMQSLAELDLAIANTSSV